MWIIYVFSKIMNATIYVIDYIVKRNLTFIIWITNFPSLLLNRFLLKCNETEFVFINFVLYVSLKSVSIKLIENSFEYLF